MRRKLCQCHNNRAFQFITVTWSKTRFYLPSLKKKKHTGFFKFKHILFWFLCGLPLAGGNVYCLMPAQQKWNIYEGQPKGHFRNEILKWPHIYERIYKQQHYKIKPLHHTRSLSLCIFFKKNYLHTNSELMNVYQRIKQ